MNVLDTDVLSHLQKNDRVGVLILSQMSTFPDPDFRITTVNAYEMLSGAVDLIRKREKEKKDPTAGFQLLLELREYLVNWHGRILPYDHASHRAYCDFPPRLRQSLRDDARIGAIALFAARQSGRATGSHFKQVPGLTVYEAQSRETSFLRKIVRARVSKSSATHDRRSGCCDLRLCPQDRP